jgi:hypothetical protein
MPWPPIPNIEVVQASLRASMCPPHPRRLPSSPAMSMRSSRVAAVASSLYSATPLSGWLRIKAALKVMTLARQQVFALRSHP